MPGCISIPGINTPSQLKPGSTRGWVTPGLPWGFRPVRGDGWAELAFMLGVDWEFKFCGGGGYSLPLEYVIIFINHFLKTVLIHKGVIIHMQP